jgi:1-acyl-sn-glycerol-3-phosphate acyltransferase
MAGYKNIPAKGPAIIACNHVSFLDPVIVGLGTRRKVNFLARAGLFEIPFFGSLIRKLGAFPLKREGVNDISAIKHSLKSLKKGELLVVFPEGTRSYDGEMQEAHAGVGLLAVKAQVPVIPAYVKGAELAMPRNSKIIKPVQITAKFGLPIYPASRNEGTGYKEFSFRIMDAIKALQ